MKKLFLYSLLVMLNVSFVTPSHSQVTETKSKEKFEILVDDDEDLPQTVNGFIMKELETFPQPGDTFTYKKLKIEIKKIGSKRVEEINVSIINDEEEEKEN